MNPFIKLFHRITGGRPMTRVSHISTFYDSVAHNPVYYFRDQFGRLWYATHAWSWTRARVTHEILSVNRK